MKPVEWHSEARRELDNAVDWYDERASLGMRLAEEVDHAVQALRAAPEACGPVPDLEHEHARRARVHGFPYHVVFAERAEAIVVVAVAHDRRRPGYWRDRLDKP